ncbi:MAG: serine O-acetyltransferase [Pseudomonadota bacterium]
MPADLKPRFDDPRVDPVWTTIREEAERMAGDEPLMASMVHAVVLNHKSLEDALSYRIADKLASPEMPALLIRELCEQALADQPEIGTAARADIMAIRDRDPFCHRMVQPLMYFKGFIGVQSYRISHWLWNHGRQDLAMFIQMRGSELFSMDINPGARIGRGLMIDHAHSIVIGETAVVGDDVSILHGVTLGGNGKDTGDRHPKIGDGVLIGAGAKVLGNIRVGNCSRVAAGSVVLKEVPPCKTVAGIPAKIVGEAGCDRPSYSMNHVMGGFAEPDVENIVPDC